MSLAEQPQRAPGASGGSRRSVWCYRKMGLSSCPSPNSFKGQKSPFLPDIALVIFSGCSNLALNALAC